MMKKARITLLLAAFLGLALIGCKENKTETEVANEQPAEGETQADDAPEKATWEPNESVLNANLATEDQLKSAGLPETLIAAVLENRPFITMNELDAVVPADLLKEQLYGQLFVPFNLNTTPEADFKMIPGVGDRMAHEFEEYRPYSSIEVFRREIGKYVDEEEVARYEQFVFVPVELNTATEADIKALPGVGDRMAHEFEEYRPYTSMEQFRKEIGKYVDDNELARLERLVYLNE